MVVPFRAMSSTSALIHQAYDPANDAAVEMGRARCRLRELGTGTDDALEAWRIVRLLEAEIQELLKTRALVEQRNHQLEGR
jgi:hypothetical protein